MQQKVFYDTTSTEGTLSDHYSWSGRGEEALKGRERDSAKSNIVDEVNPCDTHGVDIVRWEQARGNTLGFGGLR